MNPEEIAKHHEAMAAGRRAQDVIDASRTAAEVPMNKQERAEFLSHSEEMLPSQKYADAPIRPPTGGLSDSSDIHRSLSSDPLPGINQESVLSRITSPFGTLRGSFEDVTPTDHIRIGNTTTTLAVAMKMGLLVHDPRTGEYSVPAGPTPEQLATAEADLAAQEAANAPVSVITPELAETFQNMTNITGDPAVTESAVVSVIAAATSKGYAEAGKVLVNRLNLNPAQEDGEANVRHAIENGVESTISALAARGCNNGRETIEFASTLPAAEKAAIALSVLKGSPEGLQRLIAISKRLERAASIGK